MLGCLKKIKNIVNQYIHNYCSCAPNVWGVNHIWDKFTKDVVEIYKDKKTFYVWSSG